MAALKKMYDLGPAERAKLGKLGFEHVKKNYNFQDFNKRWIDAMLHIHEKHGSWETRKNYEAWEFIEL